MKRKLTIIITAILTFTMLLTNLFGCIIDSSSVMDFTVEKDGKIIPTDGSETGGGSGSGGGSAEPAPTTEYGYTSGLSFIQLSNGTYQVGAGTVKSEQTVVIPREYNGQMVSAFSSTDKFNNLQKLYYTGTATEWAQISGLENVMGSTDLYIDEQKVSEIAITGISEIRDCAFKGTTLTKVTLDSTLQKIGGGAFEGCTSLEDIVIPSSVTDIRQKALRGVPAYSEYVETVNDDLQYVVFMITNRAYFDDDIEQKVQLMKSTYGEINPTSNRMYAFGVVGPFILNHKIETIREQVDHCFELAEKYNVPVYFQMDDCKMYYTYSQDGTNYFRDEENCIHTGALDGKQYKHFYEDPDMCEWVALPTTGQTWGGQQYGALPRWIMDWGPAENFNHVIGGFPCFNSPSYLEWYDNQITEGFLYPLISNLIRLKQMGKEYLFAGVSTGWETMIPDYSEDAVITKGSTWYYNNHLESWEHTLYGMHAISNVTDQFGTKLDTEEKIAASAAAHGFGSAILPFKRAILCGNVIRPYIEHTCKLFYDKGISRGKIFSHTLGYASRWPMPEARTGQELKFDTFTVPLSVAINDYCTPSWSLTHDSAYNVDYIKQALSCSSFSPGYNSFANSEGYMQSYSGGGYASQQAYFEDFLGGNARMISFFGYDQDTESGGFVKNETNPYHNIVRNWMNGTILPGYRFSERPNLGSW